VASATRHMKSPHQVFMFSPEYKEQYIGVDYARGVKCDQWYAEGKETEVLDGHTITTTAKRNHWFSTQDWSDANCVLNSPLGECAFQYPVRVVSEGTVYNHTSKETKKFHDHYEYLSFVVGMPPLYLFDTSQVCGGPKPTRAPTEVGKIESNPTAVYNGDDSTQNWQTSFEESSGGDGNLRSKSSISSTKKSSGSGVGATVGIVVAALAVVALVAMVIVRRSKPRSRSFELMDDNETGDKSRRMNVPVVQSGQLQTNLADAIDPRSPPNRNMQIFDDPNLSNMHAKKEPINGEQFNDFV